jgi:hypothetical protein
MKEYCQKDRKNNPNLFKCLDASVYRKLGNGRNR